MKSILAALVVTALSVGSASAGKPSKPHSNGNGKSGVVISVNNYHLKSGKSFSGGWCYHGKSHCHWTHQCYLPQYKCTCYWCPSTCCYYYWCESSGCYYPVTYIVAVR